MKIRRLVVKDFAAIRDYLYVRMRGVRDEVPLLLQEIGDPIEQLIERRRQLIEFVLNAPFLNNAQKEAILGGNLIKLLRLPA